MLLLLRRMLRRSAAAPRRSHRIASLGGEGRGEPRLQLSSSERRAVQRAWQLGPPREVLSTIADQELTRSDAARLSGDCWLNDECVNVYCRLVGMTYPTCHVYSSLFYARLCETVAGFDYTGVRRWTRRVPGGVFERNVLLFPLNQANRHWTLAAVWPKERRMAYFDSLHCSPARVRQVRSTLLRYLEAEHRDKTGKPLPAGEWRMEVAVGTGETLQKDGSACGAFAAAFCALTAAGKTPPFGLHQAHVPALRARILADSLAGKLTPLL